MRRYRTTIFDYIILASLLTFFTCLFVGCVPSPQQATKPNKTLVIIAQDLSSSFKENQMNECQYKQITERMLKRSVGDALHTIAVGNVNPKLLDNGFQLESINKVKPTLDDKTQCRNRNKAIIDTFLQRLNAQIYNYKPMNGKDITNIDTSLDKINLLLNDQLYNGYKKILILISDGKHEDGKGKAMAMRQQLTATDVTVFLTGWQGNKTCFGSNNLQESANINMAFTNVMKILK